MRRIGLGLTLWLVLSAGAAGQEPKIATFAGGCFWCVEADFDKVAGVIRTTSGYTGGQVANPSYEQVSRGGTGHAEAVEIAYDPAKVSYEKLLDVFWHNIDPLAQASKAKVEARFEQPVATQIVAAGAFYKAEDYHQDYYLKNPVRYKFYRYNCGRDARLEELWGRKD